MFNRINFNYFNRFKKYLDYLIKGIFAGIMIGLGGVVYLILDNNIIASFLSSIGLLIVFMYGMNLFTSKVGYLLINKLNYLYELIIGLIGNFIGVYFVGKSILLTRYSYLSVKALELSNIKLNDNLLSIFVLSLFCGIFIYIAANNYKKIGNEIGKYGCIFLSFMIIMLCGLEHSITNILYFTLSNVWSFNTILYLLIMILGNSVGSFLIALFYNLYYKN